jgi:uncharacterized membrane protein
MNTAETSARIQDYLAAVEREAAALPAERRQELLADLSEHIEVALTERPDRVTEVLRELGDPRTIAATALHEAGGSAHKPTSSGVHPSVVALLLGLAAPASLVWVPLQPLMWVVGLALLWTSPRWTTGHKAIGTVTGVVAPLAVSVVAVAVDPAGATPQMLFALAVIVLGLAGAVWLWFTRKR